MSIDDARKALYDEISQWGNKHPGYLVKAFEALMDEKFARLSPAPVGGETEPHVLTFDYTNYRGERSTRRVIPDRVWFGSTSWHPEPQWLLSAIDLDKDSAQRDFALVDMRFAPTPPPAEPDPRECQTPLTACMDHCDCSVTPPPAEPDGGDVWRKERAERIWLDKSGLWTSSRWLGTTDMGEGYGPLPEYVRADLYADLEQRLAESESFDFHVRMSNAERDLAEALATLAERDRRIADLEAGLAAAERDRDYWHSKWLALSPATDKGGEYHYDWAAVRALMATEDVRQWISDLDKIGLVPRKRRSSPTETQP